jgi:Na+/melibiose symporter-like transporter
LLTSASLPLLIRASARIGKKYVFAAVQIAFMTLIAVPLFVRPGPNAYVPLLLVLVGVNMVLIFNNVITNSILADTVDYGQWKYGKGRSASYFAAFNFLLAIFGCVGAPWGLRLIEHFGFTPQGIVDMGRAKTAVELAFCAIPAAMSGIAVALILRIPICRQRAESIRRRLEYRSRVSASHPGSIASTYNGHESQLG